MRVPFSYLDAQFADLEPYLADLRAVVAAGDFTLGQAVAEFELELSEVLGVPHVVTVGSGTDALALPLRALGIGPGDEVITSAQTFIATVGAIAQVGATPVLVDSEDGFVLDPKQVDGAVSQRTRAIIPVHYTGNVADMPAIRTIAERHRLAVIEDSCQAIGARLNDRPAGSFGLCGALSFHPLKNLNVWGDSGAILTCDAEFAERLRRWRNHGLADRDTVAHFGWNSRMDTIQAVVGRRLLPTLEAINERRIAIAERYDAAFTDLPGVDVPPRRAGVRHVFHLYMLRVERRDALLAALQADGIEAKVHYPVPIHLQPASRDLGYRRGDFPRTETDAACIITLPAHQHLTDTQVDHTIEAVTRFYAGS